jgi:membrane protease YdiL (CAAX protease family)
MTRCAPSAIRSRPTIIKRMNEAPAMIGRSDRLNRLRSIIRNLPAPAEFCLILFVGFAPLIIIFQFPTAFQSKHLELTTGGALAFPLVELLILVPLLWIGKIRGWSVTTFGSRISWKGTGGGILLFVVAEMVCIGVTLGAQIIHPEHSPFTVGRLAVLAVLVISIINPVFEEVLETGYFIHSLQRFGMWPAVLASAVFRGLFHLQFGINAALSVFAMGVVFGFTYWRWRQMWPLIFAHSLMDLLALCYGSYHAA